MQLVLASPITVAVEIAGLITQGVQARSPVDLEVLD